MIADLLWTRRIRQSYSLLSGPRVPYNAPIGLLVTGSLLKRSRRPNHARGCMAQPFPFCTPRTGELTNIDRRGLTT